MMKSLLPIIGAVVGISLAQADTSIPAPATLNDVVIRMSYVQPPNYWVNVTQRWLRADGSYQDLIDVRYSEVTQIGAPETGTYTYSASGSTAVLTFQSGDNVSPRYTRVTLAFDTVTSGHLNGDVTFDGYPQWAQFTLRHASHANGPLNVSARSYVAPGNPAVVGCVVDTDQPRVALIRAIGPSLTKFGVSSPVSDPYLEFQTNSSHWDHLFGLDAWLVFQSGEAVNAAVALTGAFPVDLAGGDSFEVVELGAGSHTIVAGSDSGKNQGTVLLEVYFLP